VLHRVRPSEEKSFRGVRCLAFSPDGRLLAVGPWEDIRPRQEKMMPTVHLFETATGKRVLHLRLDRFAPEQMVFSPDGRMLATSEFRGPVRVFDTTTGRERVRFYGDSSRHWDVLNPLAFSPDGALLAAQAGRGEIVLRETATGEMIRKWKAHDGFVCALAFSPDGGRLLSGGADSTALLWHVLPPAPKKAWDKSAGQRVWAALAKGAEHAYPALAELIASPNPVAFLDERLKPDADVDPARIRKLVADLDDEVFDTRQQAEADLKALGAGAELALRQALAGKPSLEQSVRVKRLLAPPEAKPSGEALRELRSIQALERMGTPAAEALLEKLARGGEGGRMTIAAAAALERLEESRRSPPPPARKKPEGSPPGRLGEHKGEVHAAAFTPDGKTAFTAGRDGKVRRWDVAAAEELAAPGAHEGGAFAVAVSRDGKRLATAGADGKVRLWGLPRGRLERELEGHRRGSLGVAFSPDGKLIASGGADGRVRLWGTEDGKAGKAITVTDGRVASIAFTSDGKRLLVGSTSGGGPSYNGVVFAAHGEEGIRFWSIEDGKPIEGLKQEGHAARLFADGRLALVMASPGGCAINNSQEGLFRYYSPGVMLRESATGKEVLSLKGCGTADLSADGRFLLTGPGSTFAIGEKARLEHGATLHPEVRLWEVATGEEVLRFDVKDVTVTAFAPDGLRALLGTKSGAVYLADLMPRGVGKSKDSDSVLWDRLDSDAAAAYAAGLELAARGDAAAKFLARRFGPAAADDATMRKLIDGLSADRHVARRDAFTALAARGSEAVPALKAALKRTKDAKVRRRIEELLASPAASRPPSGPRLARTEWVLDRIGTAEAAKARRALDAWRK
jgi:WD40 repeat protein